MISPPRNFSTNGMQWPEMAAALPEDEVEKAFPDEEACRSRLVEVRWPDGVTCFKCGSYGVGFLKKRSLYYCQECQYQFSARVGTIMHNSNLSLLVWFRSVELIAKYGSPMLHLSLFRITSDELGRRLGISYVSARKLRFAVTEDLQRPESLLRDCVCGHATSAPQE